MAALRNYVQHFEVLAFEHLLTLHLAWIEALLLQDCEDGLASTPPFTVGTTLQFTFGAALHDRRRVRPRQPQLGHRSNLAGRSRSRRSGERLLVPQ